MFYQSEVEGVETVARLAAAAARTAPKSHGVDNFVIALADKQEIAMIANRMKEIGKEKEAKLQAKNPTRAAAVLLDWTSDANCVGKSDSLLLIGLDGRKVSGKNCGLCGFATCAELLRLPRVKGTNWEGPFCANLMVDLGIAISSAASVAIRHHVDNRMFFKLGQAARDLDLLPGCNVCIGLAMSVSGKNIYFDRVEKVQAVDAMNNKGGVVE